MTVAFPDLIIDDILRVNRSEVRSFLICHLVSPCNTQPCYHRTGEESVLIFDDRSISWLVDVIVTALRVGDTMCRRRAVTLLGLFGTMEARDEIQATIGDRDPEVHYAAQAALRHLEQSLITQKKKLSS